VIPGDGGAVMTLVREGEGRGGREEERERDRENKS
jgi:hypothetical protein